MKKIVMAFLVSGVLLLASCGSSNSSDKNASISAGDGDFEGAAQEYAVETTAGAYSGDYANQDIAVNTDISDDSILDVTQITNKKIIKDAYLDIEAENVEKCYDEFLTYVVSLGGYEFSQSFSNSSDYSSISAEIKLPPDKLDVVLKYAEECGKVINSSTSSKDITADYTDTEIRLENKKKSLEKYYNYYGQADTMEEMIAIQEQIDRITADIECYEGQIKLWNSLVDESTLNLYIQEASDPNKIPEDIEWNSISLSTMGKIMKNGFTSVINGIVSFFQWVIIFIVSASPIIIIAGIVLIIVLRIIKKKKPKVIEEVKIEVKENNDK